MNNSQIHTHRIIENFVVFEGIDGTGKSTQIARVSEMLSNKKISFATTMEPHNGIIGSFIRNILQHNIPDFESAYKESLASSILAYLFVADREEHLYSKHGVMHLLEQHDLVISDRYLFSTIAYQVVKNAQDFSHKLNQHFPLPKLLVYFDIPLEVAMQRMSEKKKDGLETLENLTRVHSKYNQTLTWYEEQYPKMDILRIDATKSHEQITTTITEYIVSTILTPN